ncbi:MAG: multiprotein bridging factor aMBF1 [Candidatus Micrarchaeaceae archaeon]
MEECEVCGRKSNELYLVDIEGAHMTVCKSCSTGNDILQTFSNKDKTEPKFRSAAPKDTIDVVENYGKIIRRARESFGLPTKVLAERINEKESTLIRVEKGDALPDDRLAKKLEKELDITLLVTETSDKKSFSSPKANGITFGDSVIIKDKRGKGN